MPISWEFLGLLGGGFVFIIAWQIAIERRLARLEGKINMLCRVGCGRYGGVKDHGDE